MTEATRGTSDSPAAATFRIREVLLSLDRPLRLSQAVGDPVDVIGAQLTLCWDDGTVRIKVEGYWRPEEAPGRQERVTARLRRVADLDGTNPGLELELRTLVPQAPWDQT